LVKGLNAFQTGIQFLPFAVMVGIAAPLAGVLSRSFGGKTVVTAGMTSEAVALLWMSRLLTVDASFWSLLPPLVLVGVGVGLAVPQLANLIMSSVPAEKLGVVSGANNTIRQIGAALGIAIIGAILFGAFTTQARPLIEQSNAFADFSTRVAANPSISREAKLVGVQVSALEGTIKQSIVSVIEREQSLDLGSDPLDAALGQMPITLKWLLKLQGVDLDKPETLAQIRRNLAPDIAVLVRDLQHTLGSAFAGAGQVGLLIASGFVFCGALCSLMLPGRRQSTLGETGTIGH